MIRIFLLCVALSAMGTCAQAQTPATPRAISQ